MQVLQSLVPYYGYRKHNIETHCFRKLKVLCRHYSVLQVHVSVQRLFLGFQEPGPVDTKVHGRWLPSRRNFMARYYHTKVSTICVKL